MTITYTQKGTNTSKTLTATKSNGRWSLNETPTGVSIDQTTGQVRFTDAAVATNTTITSRLVPQMVIQVIRQLLVGGGDTVPPVITVKDATATSGEHDGYSIVSCR